MIGNPVMAIWRHFNVHPNYTLKTRVHGPALCQFACARTTDEYDITITSNAHSRDVTDQLWWCHKPKKTVLGDDDELSDRWLFLAYSFVQGINIAWIRAVRHRTAVPNSSYHLLCMLEWSLSGHCINHSAQNFKGWLRKTLKISHFHLYQYLSCKFHSIFKLALISL